MKEKKEFCVYVVLIFVLVLYSKNTGIEKNHISQNKIITKGRKEVYFCTYIFQDDRSLLGYISHNPRE